MLGMNKLLLSTTRTKNKNQIFKTYQTTLKILTKNFKENQSVHALLKIISSHNNIVLNFISIYFIKSTF